MLENLYLSNKDNALAYQYMMAAFILNRYAKGAKHIYDEVRMKHYDAIKAGVRQILGARTSYYRCINGTRLITEEQQKSIANLYRRYGYNTDNLFDEYFYAF